MTERIAAKCHGGVAGNFKNLFLLGPSSDGLRESRFQAIDMEVHVHGRPVTLVVARLLGTGSWSRAGFLFEQTELGRARTKHCDAGDWLGHFGEAEGLAIEPDPVCEVWHIHAD